MKCVLIFALLAVWISSSDATSCENGISCFANLLSFLSPHEEYCRSLTEALTCASSALNDCGQKVKVVEHLIKPLQKAIDDFTSKLRSKCPGYNVSGSNGSNGADGQTGNGSNGSKGADAQTGNGSNGADALKVSALILALVFAVFNLVV